MARPRRPSRSRSKRTSLPDTIEAAIFPTSLGWIGIAGRGTTVVTLTMGHASADEVRKALAANLDGGSTSAKPGAIGNGSLVERDWHPELRRALERYAQGRFVDLGAFAIEIGPTTDYRRRVLETARRIPYGETLSYGQLAARAGKPRAARAVGSAMASNRIALLIPCHRVVGAGGIGGFSCRTGVELKRRLLELEASGARHAEPPRARPVSAAKGASRTSRRSKRGGKSHGTAANRHL
jgi:methylated-DNA-[protein]-cysteine S-methyltransferase